MNQDAGSASYTDQRSAQVAGYYQDSKVSGSLDTQSKDTVAKTATTTSMASHTPQQQQAGVAADEQQKLGQTPASATTSEGGGGIGGYGNGPSATPNSGPGAGTAGEFKSLPQGQPKRLHVSNIPFRFREPDLRQLFYVS